MNASIGLKGLQVITEPIFCNKVEANTGYTEYSVKTEGQETVYHGYYRDVIRDRVTQVGLYVKGQKCGHFWKRLEGDAYSVTSGKNVTYIYPDLTNVLYGQVSAEGHMKNGRFGKLVELKYDHGCAGLPVPKIKKYQMGAKFDHDLSTTVTICSKPLLRDPYEQQTCYISSSMIHPEAGEGLFAKRYLPKGSLVAIFNGVRLREVNGVPGIRSDYKICLERGIDLDIPNWAICAKKYCATVAHKACHSFNPNCGFYLLEHPR